MKKILILLVTFAVSLAVYSELSTAQDSKNPANAPPIYYTWKDKSAVSYWRSKSDTASPSGIKLSAASMLTVIITNTDTMKADIYIDTKPRGSVQWTNVYSDSVIKTTADSTEIKLRVPSTDRIGQMDVLMRGRIVQRATANYADSAQTFDWIWAWKP